LGVVHDLAHQGAGLTEVIVVLAHCVSGMDGPPTPRPGDIVWDRPLVRLWSSARTPDRTHSGLASIRPCCSYAPGPWVDLLGSVRAMSIRDKPIAPGSPWRASPKG
jgi:hypothetical protein